MVSAEGNVVRDSRRREFAIEIKIADSGNNVEIVTAFLEVSALHIKERFVARASAYRDTTGNESATGIFIFHSRCASIRYYYPEVHLPPR